MIEETLQDISLEAYEAKIDSIWKTLGYDNYHGEKLLWTIDVQMSGGTPRGYYSVEGTIHPGPRTKFQHQFRALRLWIYDTSAQVLNATVVDPSHDSLVTYASCEMAREVIYMAKRLMNSK